MSNIQYSFIGSVGTGTLKDGTQFIFDKENFSKIADVNFYRNKNNDEDSKSYIICTRGNYLHRYLFGHREGLEVDHINLDTLDNRSENIRFCTHQQNQINQGLQVNNTSGVTGVSFYRPRNKYRARIKISQQEVHLGYYDTFLEATQARNVGMELLFGEYGRYNDVPQAPMWLRHKVESICVKYQAYSLVNKSEVIA
ncbi:HNH endonuclease [Streptococcus agalactiae]|uniref:HNH endonuclease n=1 Tax=Streptococcus agalactiae TaxID=1311 RepID=UPI00061C3A8A|nr:HNH endonuclease [Streptococcus agalactiae]CNF12971.1 HNH endonuclease [Streptococcus agalactiae]